MNVTRCSWRRAWAIEVATQIIEDESFSCGLPPGVIGVYEQSLGYDDACKVIETHEHKGEFKEW
jgi:hypothetical protein